MIGEVVVCLLVMCGYKTKSLEENSNLKSIRRCNFNRLVLTRLNVSSISSKFDNLTQKITGNVDILMISGKKSNSSFPEGKFLIPGYSAPY